MKKMVIVICIILLLIPLLIPTPRFANDGGTVAYQAVLYCVYDVRRLTSDEEMNSGKKYDEGIIVEILGFEVFNNVK